MNIKSVYDIAGRAMAAQLVRLNTVASNLANAGSTTGDPKTTYRPGLSYHEKDDCRVLLW